MHIKVNFSPSVPTAKIILQCKFLYFLLVCTLNVVIVLSCRLCKCVICTVKWTRTCTVKYWNLSQYRKKTLHNCFRSSQHWNRVFDREYIPYHLKYSAFNLGLSPYIQQDLISFVGRRYNCLDVSAMLSMVIGLILFTLADSSISPNFNTYGGYTCKN